ncbi:MAG: TRAP transporter TatT component family protein [Pseudomarimonas sp.]
MSRTQAKIWVLVIAATLTGCASVAQRAANDLASDLQRGIFDHDDPATVAAGLPAYLLLIDGLLSSRPDNTAMLQAAAGLYSAYAGNFVDDVERGKRLSARGFEYARRATCMDLPAICAKLDGPVDEFVNSVASAPASSVSTLHTLGTAWAGYVQAHSDDWAAIAALPKAQAVIERVVALDPDYQKGLPWAYLGVLHSLRPEGVGGEPERGRAAFEQSISRSEGANLMAKTLFAERYARLVFDRELHDRLLTEVLAADPKQAGFTLANHMAQTRAAALMAAADDYF